MGPHIVNCGKCGKSVDATHLINALNKHNVFNAIDIAIRILKNKPLTPTEARYKSLVVWSNNNVPYGQCSLCRQ